MSFLANPIKKSNSCGPGRTTKNVEMRFLKRWTNLLTSSYFLPLEGGSTTQRKAIQPGMALKALLTSSLTQDAKERKKVKPLSCVQLFATSWSLACQSPSSMGFSRQEYWSGLPFPPPGHLPDPGIEPGSPPLQADSVLSELPGMPKW